MNTNNKSTQIKQTISKIDLDKIASYPQHPESKTLRKIIRYSQRILNSDKEKEIFKLAVKIAYLLDVIVNINKYVKNKKEKEHYLEISQKLFENTVGLKDKK
jgi:ABC-type oligopeptide transport system ATPase subunit